MRASTLGNAAAGSINASTNAGVPKFEPSRVHVIGGCDIAGA
jgi:hypothetical protein